MPSPKKTPPTKRNPKGKKRPLPSQPWKVAFADDILQLVVKPALLATARQGVTSIADFRAKFTATHNCSVPASTFRAWLRDLSFDSAFTAPRHVHLEAPPTRTFNPALQEEPRLPPTDPLAVLQQDPNPMGGDADDFRFDNEKPGFVHPQPFAIDSAAVDQMLAKDPTLQHLVLGSPPPADDGGAARPVTFIPVANWSNLEAPKGFTP